MKNCAYPAIIKKSRDGTYDVQFVNFKEGFTDGNTLDEARENACEVLSPPRKLFGFEESTARAHDKEGRDFYFAGCQNAQK